MSDLKTQDIAALRTSCNTDVIDWRNQLIEIQGDFS